MAVFNLPYINKNGDMKPATFINQPDGHYILMNPIYLVSTDGTKRIPVNGFVTINSGKTEKTIKSYIMDEIYGVFYPVSDDADELTYTSRQSLSGN